jgi:Tfp pilus assembly protein FimT
MLRNKKIKGGFTTFELLVVMFIIGLLATLTFAGYHNGQKRYTLSQDSQRLMSSLRKAQNMAMEGINISGNYYGYGVYAEKGNAYYLIYADKDNNSSFQPSDDVLETVNLSDKVGIENVSPLSDKIDIFFGPPDPTTYINANSTAGVSGTVTLGLSDSSLNKTITVTTAGLINRN